MPPPTKNGNKGLRVSALGSLSLIDSRSARDTSDHPLTYPAAGGEDRGLRRAVGARDAAVAAGVDLANAATFVFVVCEGGALRSEGRLLGAPDATGTALRREDPDPGPAATARGVAASMAV